ncbi:SRPBCC family protein [Archangium sp.]|uniref:SRPBCC family protein n=1 Tax=Archangium sp. TaxID=1872627 RepID=UPI002D259724|nr:SRPBCC family protein [Archangium sp.]HYO59757.1 SRPBCC family protein [Archangium sp.]
MKVDVIKQIGAVTRQVRSSERDGKPAQVVVASRTYSTTPDDLWNTITDPERLRRWFSPVSGELRLGGRYQIEGNASGTITACEPQKSFALTWEYGGDTSWLAVRLTPVANDRTRLDLEHTQIPGDHWKKYGAGATGVGWDLTLLGLDQFTTEGRTVDPIAWPASDEGKDYMRRASDDWARAAIASGANEAEARGQAARTSAFYTGETTPDAH